MDIYDAQMIVRDSFYNYNPTEEDEFRFIEALEFLIKETKDPYYMMLLGGLYYGEKRYDLALKYYEMAAEYEYIDAYIGLGYVWYYGRTGEKDYEKAFKYYSLAMDAGDLVSTYKIADMYKNGYYVEKDYEKYKKIIKELYPKVKDAKNPEEPLPEVFTRLARIYVEEGKKDEAVELYLKAKSVLAERIRDNAFFGNLNIMKWLIDDLYELIPFNKKSFDFYDLYYLLKLPNKITFYKFIDDQQFIETVKEEGGVAINFNGKWFRDRDEFFDKAESDGDILNQIYDHLYGFEVL